MKKGISYLHPAATSFLLSVRESDAPQVTPEMQAIIDAQVAQRVATEVSGLKTKNDELLGKNKELNTKLTGFDIEGYNQWRERLDKDEDARLVAEGKTTELVQKYTERMRNDHGLQLAEKDKAIEAANQRSKRFEQAVLDNEIRQACTGMHPSAVEDALLHGRNVFSLDAEGKAVKLDAEGRLEIGKDGKNPFSPAEWIESLKETKPHWFPASSSGSGSSGSQGAGQARGKTITRAKFDALSPAEKQKAAMDGVQII